MAVNISALTIYQFIMRRMAPARQCWLHGGLGSIEGMSYQIRALARSHFVVAADSRGNGRSTDSDEPLSYSLMSDDMAKLLDRLHLGQVNVVGWSDGGIVELDLALRHSEHVRKLVAISANYDVNGVPENANFGPETPRMPLGYRLLARDTAHWPVFYRKVVTLWQTEPHYTLNELRQSKHRLVMAGEFDVVRRRHSAQLTKAIPGSQEVIVEGATHTAPNDKPEIVNSNILRFLDNDSASD
jgi:pimeloyl-ACP methyl ester carboxylesterase